MRMKHVSRREVEKLPQTTDDSAALKMYLLAEVSRNERDEAAHDALIAQMVERFPTSRWLEEALYSGGNMYLIKHDPKQATYHYSLLVKMFPTSTYAASAHWRAAWMNYRLGNYSEAARLMEEQIQGYPAGIEVPSALYWRGRIYEEQERNFGQAVNFYRALTASYTNYYYSLLARQRLNVLKGQTAAAVPAAVLSAVQKPVVPPLTGELPENEPHLIKARLLANAALNEYIGPEIQASPTASQWGALGQAEIYSSFGETPRALQSMKRSGISFFALPLDQVPTVYWKAAFSTALLERSGVEFAEEWVGSISGGIVDSAGVGVNAGAISHANAWGLMQLLPSVGKSMARKEGLKGFSTNSLLNPSVNLQLGTKNLRLVLDRFGGQVEYALAAYNAGDVPVRAWMSAGNYRDIAEYVESIPYTETREYVQAILRNREIYRALYSTPEPESIWHPFLRNVGLTGTENELCSAPEVVHSMESANCSWRSLPQPELSVGEETWVTNEDNRWDEEASMVAELNLLEVWIPEQMQPGTIFLLEQAGELGRAENPYWAVLACPSCGSLGLITRQQCAGLEAMICGSSECSAEYFLEGQTIRYRPVS